MTRKTWLPAVCIIAAVAIIVVTFTAIRFGSPVDARIHPDETIQVDETTRHYRLVVPNALSDGEKVPIVIALHGIGDEPESMPNYSRLDQLAALRRFILVYPQALRSMWRVDAASVDDIGENPDIRFFDALVTDLLTQFPIDDNRIYVVGMSNGATFAQLLARVRPNTIAAVAAHSGPPPLMPDQFVDESQFRILILVGANDSPVTVQAIQSATNDYRRAGHVVELDIIRGVGHEWSTSHNSRIWEFLSAHRRVP